jgi:hypothetical protein
MMVLKCMNICYVLFWTVLVPPSDPKGLFMEHVIMFTMPRGDMGRLSEVACYFLSFYGYSRPKDRK